MRRANKKFSHLPRHTRARLMARDGFGAEDIAHECEMEFPEAWRIVKEDDEQKMKWERKGAWS